MMLLLEAAFGRFKHRRNGVTEHADSQKADLLVLANLAEVGDTDRKVGERAVADDGREMLLVQTCHNLESGVCDAF